MTTDLLFKNFHLLAGTPDGVKQLRQLILQLAVQGRLVPQNPDDPPANELLQQIKTEKQRLIKKGRIKKQKPLPEIKPDEVPYDLPQGWVWVRLGSVTTYGLSEKVEPKLIDDSIWVLELEDIEKITSRLLRKKKSCERKPKSTKTVFRHGDVIYGKLRPYLDKAIIADEPGVCTTEMIPLNGYGVIDCRYIRWFLKTSNFIDYANNSTHGMNLPRLSTEKARLALLPIPPLPEQHRIVAKVDQLMALCDGLEARQKKQRASHARLNKSVLHVLTESRTRDELTFNWTRLRDNFSLLFTTPESIQELRSSILQLAVQGRLVPQNPDDEPAQAVLEKAKHFFEGLVVQKKMKKLQTLPAITDQDKPFTLPTGWAWSRLGELIKVSSGDGLSSKDMIEGHIPVYGGNGIAGFHNKYNIEKQTLVIGRVGYYCGSVHITPDKAWVTDNAFITYFNDHVLNIWFLKYLLNATDFRKHDNATAQPVISGAKIYPIIIGLPPLPEQHRIVTKVDQLMALCAELEASLTKSQADGQKLMQSVVVGCYPQPVISQKMFNGSEKTYPHKIIFQESI